MKSLVEFRSAIFPAVESKARLNSLYRSTYFASVVRSRHDAHFGAEDASRGRIARELPGCGFATADTDERGPHDLDERHVLSDGTRSGRGLTAARERHDVMELRPSTSMTSRYLEPALSGIRQDEQFGTELAYPGRTRVHVLGVALFEHEAVCRIAVLLEIIGRALAAAPRLPPTARLGRAASAVVRSSDSALLPRRRRHVDVAGDGPDGRSELERLPAPRSDPVSD